jgi:hypothetical protein
MLFLLFLDYILGLKLTFKFDFANEIRNAIESHVQPLVHLTSEVLDHLTEAEYTQTLFLVIIVYVIQLTQCLGLNTLHVA